MNLTIYIDVLFLINFILDYIILATTAFLNEKKPNTYRLLAAASVGAVYNVIIFFPRLSILNIFAFRVLISFLINLIAFKYLNLVNYCKNILVYYIWINLWFNSWTAIYVFGWIIIVFLLWVHYSDKSAPLLWQSHQIKNNS